MISEEDSPKPVRDRRFQAGVGHVFPAGWTDEQKKEWELANCQCEYHRKLREEP